MKKPSKDSVKVGDILVSDGGEFQKDGAKGKVLKVNPFGVSIQWGSAPASSFAAYSHLKFDESKKESVFEAIVSVMSTFS